MRRDLRHLDGVDARRRALVVQLADEGRGRGHAGPQAKSALQARGGDRKSGHQPPRHPGPIGVAVPHRELLLPRVPPVRLPHAAVEGPPEPGVPRAHPPPIAVQVPLQRLPPLRPRRLQGRADLHEVLLVRRADPPVRFGRCEQNAVQQHASAAAPGGAEGRRSRVHGRGGRRGKPTSGEHRQRLDQHLHGEDGVGPEQPGRQPAQADLDVAVPESAQD